MYLQMYMWNSYMEMTHILVLIIQIYTCISMSLNIYTYISIYVAVVCCSSVLQQCVAVVCCSSVLQ